MSYPSGTPQDATTPLGLPLPNKNRSLDLGSPSGNLNGRIGSTPARLLRFMQSAQTATSCIVSIPSSLHIGSVGNRYKFAVTVPDCALHHNRRREFAATVNVGTLHL